MSVDSGKASLWLEYAEADLAVGHRCLAPERAYPDLACYHAQQSAEKALKGFLVSRKVEFARTHSLVYLLNLCTEQDRSFSRLRDVAASLQDYAARARYPSDEFNAPDVDEARKALQDARSVCDLARERIPTRSSEKDV